MPKLKEIIKENNLSLKKLKINREIAIKESKKRHGVSLNKILVKDYDYSNIYRLKIRLINEDKLEYKCEKCGNEGVWKGKELTLQLDHINGDHQDHRLKNLRFLCPNCHSQTDTFSGKNTK